MLPNYLIRFLDNNYRIRSFYSINNFLKFLEFNSSFPGLFQYENNNIIYRWTVKYNINHYSFGYIRLFNYETRTISKPSNISDDLKINKQIQSSSIFDFPINPSTTGMSLVDNFWMTPSIDDLNFLRIFEGNFARIYTNTNIWYISSIKTYAVTIASVNGGNRYHIDRVDRPTLTLVRGTTYIFDQSSTTNRNQSFRLSTTSDGTHGGGVSYTTGLTVVGTPGKSGAYTQFVVANDAPSILYYYCTQYSDMGGTINITGATISYTVTIALVSGENRYQINGDDRPTLTLVRGTTYIFDQSSTTNSNQPFRLSTTSDGTHGGGVPYTTGLTVVGTPGQVGAYIQVVLTKDAPSTLYYYSTQHPDMGGTITISGGAKWFGYDGVNRIFYPFTDSLMNVLQAILLDWFTDNSQRLTITEI